MLDAPSSSRVESPFAIANALNHPARPCLQGAEGSGRGGGRGPRESGMAGASCSKHGLSSNTMALITSGCGATRLRGRQLTPVTSGCTAEPAACRASDCLVRPALGPAEARGSLMHCPRVASQSSLFKSSCLSTSPPLVIKSDVRPPAGSRSTRTSRQSWPATTQVPGAAVGEIAILPTSPLHPY